ncbi:MAG: hypothetical protein ACI9MR_001447 [Myxococcota bacterium]|jgi:hypothetical protein
MADDVELGTLSRHLDSPRKTPDRCEDLLELPEFSPGHLPVLFGVRRRRGVEPDGR